MGKAISKEQAMKNASSSTGMEGLRVTAEMVELCRKALYSGRSTKECLEQFRNKKSESGEK